ncbi:MAG: ankyrin repeat domain-containing protein [Acetobacteraceae bacterium]|nr:ankyrin repeat domain-containing protein [Acetobacteraceae bacterium]
MARLMARVLAVALLSAPLPGLAQAPPASAPAGAAPPAGAAAGAAAGPGGRAAVPAGTPTEQLFDAIALGNIEIVRDAIGRGANLNARNVLGQRPVDLAIDVGRSDIAFLLLSMMRAGQPDRAALPPAAAVPPARPAGRGRQDQATVTAPAAPPRHATLWRNDGGTPQPDIGFLGFDASRTEFSRPPAGGRPGAPRRGG